MSVLPSRRDVDIGIDRSVAPRERHPTIDQHEPITSIGVPLGGVGDDEATERVPQQRRPPRVEVIHHRDDVISVRDQSERAADRGTSGPAAMIDRNDRNLAATISAQSGAKTVTAAGALVYAIKSLGANRVAFASPYVPVINDQAIAFLASEGIETVSRADVEGTLDNQGQGAMTPEDVTVLAKRADSEKAKAVVLSCTDMRSVEAIDRLERELGKPVVTSNQAMMFQAMELAGLTEAPTGFGQLFERTQP